MNNKTEFTKKQNFYMYMVIVYSVFLVVSNIIVGRTFQVGVVVLSVADLLFPVVYIINDVMTECYGLKNAKRMILTAFGVNLFCTLFFMIVLKLPTPYDFSCYDAVFGNTLRALIASFTAYLVGSYANALVMHKMKQNSKLMTRCIVSTMVGETLDAVIVATMMFWGIMTQKEMLSYVISLVISKTLYEVIVFPATKKVINKVNSLEH